MRSCTKIRYYGAVIASRHKAGVTANHQSETASDTDVGYGHRDSAWAIYSKGALRRNKRERRYDVYNIDCESSAMAVVNE
jgi:hypothetical protein